RGAGGAATTEGGQRVEPAAGGAGIDYEIASDRRSADEGGDAFLFDQRGAALDVPFVHRDDAPLQAEAGEGDRQQSGDVEEGNGEQRRALRRTFGRLFEQAGEEGGLEIELPGKQGADHVAMGRDGALGIPG